MFGAFIHELCDANLRNLDHPTHMTYYGNALVNETNTIPPSTVLKKSFFRVHYLLFILQLAYEHKGHMKLLRLNVNCRLNYAYQQIISLAKGHLFEHCFIKVANLVGRLLQ